MVQVEPVVAALVASSMVPSFLVDVVYLAFAVGADRAQVKMDFG